MSHKNVLRITVSSLCLALALTLPFLTGQLPTLGSMLLPMHIPVLLCGFLCGWAWGLGVGVVAPLLRSVTFGMPPLFPTAVCMAVELAVYGAACGLMHRIMPKNKAYVYVSLLVAMVAGRVAWGFAMLLCMGVKGNPFTFSAFISGAVLNAIPGIILQIILVPVLVMALDNKRILNLSD